MMMTCLGIAIFLTLFAGNVNALSDWQVTVPEKEHVASYQIVCDDWKIHYVVNGNEYQYCLKLTQENQGKYEKALAENLQKLRAHLRTADLRQLKQRFRSKKD